MHNCMLNFYHQLISSCLVSKSVSSREPLFDYVTIWKLMWGLSVVQRLSVVVEIFKYSQLDWVLSSNAFRSCGRTVVVCSHVFQRHDFFCYVRHLGTSDECTLYEAIKATANVYSSSLVISCCCHNVLKTVTAPPTGQLFYSFMEEKSFAADQNFEKNSTTTISHWFLLNVLQLFGGITELICKNDFLNTEIRLFFFLMAFFQNISQLNQSHTDN